MRWVCHLIAHHFHLKQLPKSCFQMASVLSVSRQQPTLFKCWKMASFFEKLILGTLLWLMVICWYSYLIYTELVPCDWILCMLGNFSQFFVVCCYFFQIHLFPRNYFRNTIRVSNSFDQDQAQHSVGPDLGPNCLQRLLSDDPTKSLIYGHF